MSNELAIAACTSTLRHVLQDWFNNSGMTADVTTLPLDRASQDNPTNRVNLFLYHMLPNATWRNQPIPQRGENSTPPLALNLYYLLTAYGDDVNGSVVEETDHKLLGHAMTVFHDRPVLTEKDIRDATSASDGASGPTPVTLNQSDLHKQMERIRITPEPLNLDELMKLWGTFHQSPYRISASYQASVVLLESRGSTASPFPVLARGENDIGPDVDPALAPRIDRVDYRDGRTTQPPLSAARVGDIVTIDGSNLPVNDSRLVLIDPKVRPKAADPEANIVARFTPLDGSTDSRLIVQITNPETLVAGQLIAVLESGITDRPERPTISNAVSFLLASRLTPDDTERGTVSAIPDFDEDRQKLIVISTPRPGLQRSVELLLTPTDNSPPPRAIPREPSPTPDPAPDEIKFDVGDVPTGRYRIRLRVESPRVESLPIRRIGDRIVLDSRQEVQL